MMLYFYFLCAIFGPTLASPFLSSPNHPEWVSFKQTHEKTYSSLAEEHYRFQLFMDKKDKIEKHNQEFAEGKHTFQVGTNHLSDWSLEELKQLNGYIPPPPAELAMSQPDEYPPMSLGAPSYIDWRRKGAVTPVQNQGHCGSCYTFAATAALESHLKIKTGSLVKLSEQNLLDCSKTYGNNGCRGGLPTNCYNYIKANQGIDTERYYPYQFREGYCHYSRSGYGGTDAGFYRSPSGDENALKNVVGTRGPATVGIDVSDWKFQSYKTGVYKSTVCRSGMRYLGHAVTVVGYGTENRQDYWLVKNSYGTGFGDNGYIKMARNYGNMCGIATDVVWPKV